jgi:MlaC protein
MTSVRVILAYFLCMVLATSASAAGVSASRQSCIQAAMAAGSAALGNPAQLNRLYERYFAGDRLAQIAAGDDWNRYSNAQKDAQRRRARQVTVYTLGTNLASYGGSRVQFLAQSGPKVKGIVTAPNGQRSTVTWHFIGPCKFINVSIEGYGSLVSAIGKMSSKK